MRCPHCGVTTADNLLQCSSCWGDVGFILLGTDGQPYGGYTREWVEQLLAAGQSDLAVWARVGAWPWMPLVQVLDWTATPALEHCPITPEAPRPLSGSDDLQHVLGMAVVGHSGDDAGSRLREWLRKAAWLIAEGADVNSRDDHGRTHLHRASMVRMPDFARLLLARGADVHARTPRGETPLHRAAEAGNPELVQLLLVSGADTNASDGEGKTALHVAAKWAKVDAARALLAHGARVDARDSDGLTPLHDASGASHDDAGHRAVAEVLLAHTVDARDRRMTTPLHEAAGRGNTGLTEVLLTHGADVSATNQVGWTPLHCAADGGHHGVAASLIGKGAEVNASNTDGYTPLHLAAREGREAVAASLLANGADANAQDGQGRTPRTLAAKEDHQELVELLAEHGGTGDGVTYASLGLTGLADELVRLGDLDLFYQSTVQVDEQEMVARRAKLIVESARRRDLVDDLIRVLLRRQSAPAARQGLGLMDRWVGPQA